MFHFGTLPVQEKADVLEVDHRFIPSVENEPMRLNTFLDENGAVVNLCPWKLRKGRQDCRYGYCMVNV